MEGGLPSHPRLVCAVLECSQGQARKQTGCEHIAGSRNHTERIFYWEEQGCNWVHEALRPAGRPEGAASSQQVAEKSGKRMKGRQQGCCLVVPSACSRAQLKSWMNWTQGPGRAPGPCLNSLCCRRNRRPKTRCRARCGRPPWPVPRARWSPTRRRPPRRCGSCGPGGGWGPTRRRSCRCPWSCRGLWSCRGRSCRGAARTSRPWRSRRPRRAPWRPSSFRPQQHRVAPSARCAGQRWAVRGRRYRGGGDQGGRGLCSRRRARRWGGSAGPQSRTPLPCACWAVPRGHRRPGLSRRAGQTTCCPGRTRTSSRPCRRRPWSQGRG